MFNFRQYFRLTRSQFELAKFSFYLLTPISVMYYVGIDTDRKFSVPGYWPDPDTLNKIPKEPYEIQAELARMRAAKIERRKRLEEKAKAMGITPDDDDADENTATQSAATTFTTETSTTA
ncbi:unnamed protein product [[Candida] boidinii]|uniref:Unnamed protein product n=1 Tax=Candida boidinii TaxID=5477 RepID=A0A9W6SX72_CANBO|nr:hypothetical protein BVG19_g700 [[Candida] boidinii]OWB49292.1 hypothetical protein B5S27_g832 [[Candida] boidinii]OWB67881.1 hypothetical protein B5S30_g3249 [[Candida] boidinii]OWB83346.1 hypothetical protein B5S33_g1975 [[Candida] boidinii]GME68819.1 unnamed protein product [[Candida] boidinii]